MTINCARCHDHKVDPIPQRDYYRLLAFFQDIVDPDGKNLKKVAARAGARIEVMCVAERGRRETHVLLARQSQPRRATRSSRACPRSRAATRRRSSNGPGKRRALADWLTDRQQPADGPGHGQPALAVSFRSGHRADAQ